MTSNYELQEKKRSRKVYETVALIRIKTCNFRNFYNDWCSKNISHCQRIKLPTTTRNSYFLSIEKSGIKLFLELNLGWRGVTLVSLYFQVQTSKRKNTDVILSITKATQKMISLLLSIEQHCTQTRDSSNGLRLEWNQSSSFPSSSRLRIMPVWERMHISVCSSLDVYEFWLHRFEECRKGIGITRHWQQRNALSASAVNKYAYVQISVSLYGWRCTATGKGMSVNDW